MGRVVRGLMGQVRVLAGPLVHGRRMSKRRVRRVLIERRLFGRGLRWGGLEGDRLGRLRLATDGQEAHGVVVGRHGGDVVMEVVVVVMCGQGWEKKVYCVDGKCGGG